MKRLNYELKELCKRNRDGSFATQHDRKQLLQLIANQLPALGYPHMSASSLKPKHVVALVNHWQTEKLAVGTIKQRMTALRWWAGKVGKANVVARSNAFYHIAAREYVANTPKGRALCDKDLSLITDAHVVMSLKLQQAFGLRKEESIKFNPRYADRGDFVQLKASWTKGGKARTIPVTTSGQRAVLNEAKHLVGAASLIPSHRSYIQQRYVYDKQTQRAGLHKLHGLRHQYAQQRYKSLTGWDCPVCGGPSFHTLSPAMQQRDKQIRQIVSGELGHERLAIVAVYLGK